MIALSRPRDGLAFLSDEVILIPAGMLFAGYGGVVGTMWSINDKLVPRVARDVYARSTVSEWQAARALHGAVGHLRESNASFVEWLPFIHVGL